MGRKSKQSETRGHRKTVEKHLRARRRRYVKLLLLRGSQIPGEWRHHFHRHLSDKELGDRVISIVSTWTMCTIPVPEDDEMDYDRFQADVDRSFAEDARNGLFPIDDPRNSNYRGEMGIFEDYTGPDNPNALSSEEEAMEAIMAKSLGDEFRDYPSESDRVVLEHDMMQETMRQQPRD